jgi:hypothetical protein
MAYVCDAVANHYALKQFAFGECGIPYPRHMVWYDYFMQTCATVERFVADVCDAVWQEYICEIKASSECFFTYADN